MEAKTKAYTIWARIRKNGGPDLRFLRGHWRTGNQKRGDKARRGPRN